MDWDESGKHAGWISSRPSRNGLMLEAGGDWIVAEATRLDSRLRTLVASPGQPVEIDASKIRTLDSVGAWLLVRTRRALESRGRQVTRLKVPELYGPLIESIDTMHKAPPVEIERGNTFEAMLERIGRTTFHLGSQAYRMLGYLGRVTVESIGIFAPRGKLRVPALVCQIEETGLNALPITGLLLFLIGIVLAYQGADQLSRVGAERFTVNLLGISILRELGVLITAIIVAGRSGSAFTAQIGTMRVNEEIDAMRTMGLNPVDVLVIPRIAGLMVSLPLLTLYADVVALLGGATMCYFDLGITIPVYLRELRMAVSPNNFWVGMIKAPVFALVIGLVGCFEGLQVERNAAGVGRSTTRSVVEAIFLVIVLDAGFSVMFSVLGI